MNRLRVYSLKDGTLAFIGSDPRRPAPFVKNDLLTLGARGEPPEELARQLEHLAVMIRDVARDYPEEP